MYIFACVHVYLKELLVSTPLEATRWKCKMVAWNLLNHRNLESVMSAESVHDVSGKWSTTTCSGPDVMSFSGSSLEIGLASGLVHRCSNHGMN